MSRWLLLLALTTGCGRFGFDTSSTGPGGGDGSTGDGGGTTSGDSGGPSDAPATGARFVGYAGTNPPPVRRSSGAALEPGATERLWMFGGYSGTYLNDLYAFTPSANSWSSFVGTGVPGPRERHVLAWDPVGNVLVQFGGQYRPIVSFTHYDTLYIYTPATNTWTQIPKVGSWPAARKDSSLVWVPHLGKFLLYGGDDGANANNRFSDLWLLTLDASTATGSWVQLTPGGVTAPAQSSGCVGYDPAGHRLILYGGETQDGIDVNTTYQYLLDTNVWQLDATTGTPPQGQSFAQCAWDPVINRLVAYGGQNTGGAPLGGTASTYDPDTKTWASPATITANPGARSDGGAVYSANLSGLLWFGGRTATTTYTNESWLLDVN